MGVPPPPPPSPDFEFDSVHFNFNFDGFGSYSDFNPDSSTNSILAYPRQFGFDSDFNFDLADFVWLWLFLGLLSVALVDSNFDDLTLVLTLTVNFDIVF